MTKLFDGGHEHLFEAECSGLRAAWRRAAELSAQRAHVEPTEARGPGGWRSADSLVGAAVATLLLGLHTAPFISPARETSVPDSGIERSPATKASSD
jgi:hypothetical protein